MTLKISGIVQKSNYFDGLFTGAINQEVARLFHARRSRRIAAERQMIKPSPFKQEVGPGLRPWSLRIMGDITQRL